MTNSNADLIVANDLLEMKKDTHIAFIISKEKVEKVDTKNSLTEKLLTLIAK